MTNRTRRAATFVEMVVIAAMLAVMIALLLPTIRRVKAVEGRTACLDQMRQIAQGATAYAKDHNGLLVDANKKAMDVQSSCGIADPPTGFTGPVGELLKLNYLADPKLLRCPSIPDGIQLGGKERIAYMMNPHPATALASRGYGAAFGRTARYKKLSEMPAWRCLVIDFMYNMQVMPHNNVANQTVGVNVVFPDGHAAQSDNKDIYKWALKLPGEAMHQFGWDWTKTNTVTGFNEHLLAKKNPDPKLLGTTAPGGGSIFDPYDPPVAP